MESAEGSLMTFRRARGGAWMPPVRVAEVPVEHSVSLPLPSGRWSEPAFVQFASPAIRRPGAPPEHGPPDRWWAISASGGRLIVYALELALPFAGGLQEGTVAIPPVAPTLDALRDLLADLDDAMDRVSGDFFRGEPGEPESRRRAQSLLDSAIPAPLVPLYRALAPDFFPWLEA